MRKPRSTGHKIRWRVRGLALLTMSTLVAATGAVEAHAAGRSAASRALDPALAHLAASSPRRSVEVIVQFRAGVSQKRAQALLRAHAGHGGTAIPLIHGVDLSVPARVAAALAGLKEVHAVSLDGGVKSQTVNFNPGQLETGFDQSIGATNIWNQATGTGVGVAVIDSGVDGDLPDFRTSPTNATSRVIASAVVNPDATSSDDPYGHGTDVAALIAGDGGGRPLTDPLFGDFAGSAPNANIIAVKVGDDNGDASVLDVINGIEFAIEHQAQYNIRVINLSVESDSAQSYTTDPLDAAVEAAWQQGIVVVVSVGNLGTDSDAVDYAPGNDPYVISVGATDDPNNDNVAQHTLNGAYQLEQQTLQQQDQQKLALRQQSDHNAEQALTQSNQQAEQTQQANDKAAEQAKQQADQQALQTLQTNDKAAEQALQGSAQQAKQQADHNAEQALTQSNQQAEQTQQANDKAAEQAKQQADQQALQTLQTNDKAAQQGLQQSDQQSEQGLQQQIQAQTPLTPGSVIPSWSSRGVTQDGFAEPNIYAPGAHIMSLLSPDSAFSTECPTCIFAGQYIRASGTSLAAPIVAGVAADVLQVHPNWTPNMVKGALTYTAQQLPGMPGGGASAGLVNAQAALNAPSRDLVSNQGLTPSGLVGSELSDMNASWSRSSWRVASGSLSAPWSRSSWSCDTCTGSSGSSGNGNSGNGNSGNGNGNSGSVSSSRSSWSRSSWSRSSWSRSSWSRSSWSVVGVDNLGLPGLGVTGN